jgi:hypothetical protein
MQAKEFFQSNTKFYIKFGIFILVVCTILYFGWKLKKKYEVAVTTIQ